MLGYFQEPFIVVYSWCMLSFHEIKNEMFVSLIVVRTGDECSDLEEAPRLILCYVSSNVTFPNAQVDVCRCTHLIVPFGTQITQNNGNLTLDEGNVLLWFLVLDLFLP